MKRVLAWIAIIAIAAAYVVALVFAVRGDSMAVPVAMSCILGITYLSFYFHIGKTFADILKRYREKKEERSDKEDKNKDE